MAESLVRADMRGIDTHGVHFLTLLASRVDAGMIQIPTHLKVIKDEGATGLIDGGDGLGQVAAYRAMEMSIEKARRFGIGSVSVRKTNNVGILAFYTIHAAEEGMIGIIMSNAALPCLPGEGWSRSSGRIPSPLRFREALRLPLSSTCHRAWWHGARSDGPSG